MAVISDTKFSAKGTNLSSKKYGLLQRKMQREIFFLKKIILLASASLEIRIIGGFAFICSLSKDIFEFE
jgi:hypothetical protein